MAGKSRFGGIALALANPQFRIYTLGNLPSLLGTWVQRLAIAWLAWKLTHSHAWVGAVALAVRTASSNGSPRPKKQEMRMKLLK